MQTIKVGGVPEHFNLPWHLAIESQQFESQNINLEWKDFHGGTGAMCKALREKEIDLAVILTEGMITDIAKGNPAKILQYYVLSPLLWGIHVPANSTYQTPNDVEGKTYAISRLGSGSHLMAYVDAHQRNWNLEQLQFEIVGNLDGARQALTSRQADIFFWEKYTTQPYVDHGEFWRVGVCPTPWSCFVLAVRSELVEAMPETIQTIQHIVNQSCSKMVQRADLIQLISERYDLQQEQVQEWFEITRWETEAKIDLQSLEKVTNYLKMLQIVPQNFEVAMLI